MLPGFLTKWYGSDRPNKNSKLISQSLSSRFSKARLVSHCHLCTTTMPTRCEACLLFIQHCTPCTHMPDALLRVVWCVFRWNPTHRTSIDRCHTKIPLTVQPHNRFRNPCPYRNRIPKPALGELKSELWNFVAIAIVFARRLKFDLPMDSMD
jgi:hypothetical protein